MTDVQEREDKLSDIEAENAILTAMFEHGVDAYVELCDVIDCETFSSKRNKFLYRALEKAFQTAVQVDLPSVMSAANQLGIEKHLTTDGMGSHIEMLMESHVRQDNLMNFAAQIKKFELARKMVKISSRIALDVNNLRGDETIDEILAIAEVPLVDLLQEDDPSKQTELIGEGLDDYIEYIKENQCDQIGISSGLPRFDAAIGGGLRRKCVDLVSARPKVGKSVFGDNIAINVCKNGIPALMLDTEMSKEDHFNRLIANISGVPINDVATAKFMTDPEQNIAVMEAVEEIKAMPYTYASVAGQSIDKILNIIKRWVLHDVGTDENGRTNDCVVVYDYLKLMSSSSISNNIQEFQALGFQITALHNLSVKYDFACVAFVQLNREGITKESTDAVSGSDRLVWLCTSFSIFKLKSPEELAEDGPAAGNRKLVPLVCRHGPGMEDGNYININMGGSHARIKELRTRDEMRANPNIDGAIEGAELPFNEETLDGETDLTE